MATATQEQVREKPILFSGPMVKAILEGRKTQTRRVVKDHPVDMVRFIGRDNQPTGEYGWCPYERVISKHVRCSYGQVGDRLWVRETWQSYRANSEAQQAVIKRSLDRFERGEVTDIVAEVNGWPVFGEGERKVLFASDFGAWAYDVDSGLKPWRPSIFMPRAFSRLTLEITNVRVERLQEISCVDVLAEGSPVPLREHSNPELGLQCVSAKEWFSQGWDTINGKRKGCTWADNAFVWVIEFKML